MWISFQEVVTHTEALKGFKLEEGNDQFKRWLWLQWFSAPGPLFLLFSIIFPPALVEFFSVFNYATIPSFPKSYLYFVICIPYNLQ